MGENEIPQVEKKWRKQEKPANDTAVAVTDGCFCSIYTSEYTPPFVSSTTSGFFFFWIHAWQLKASPLCLGAGGGYHKRPLPSFLPVSAWVASISLSDKGPRLELHSYLNVSSKGLQETKLRRHGGKDTSQGINPDFPDVGKEKRKRKDQKMPRLIFLDKCSSALDTDGIRNRFAYRELWGRNECSGGFIWHFFSGKGFCGVVDSFSLSWPVKHFLRGGSGPPAWRPLT